jgi:hypothetical protein
MTGRFAQKCDDYDEAVRTFKTSYSHNLARDAILKMSAVRKDLEEDVEHAMSTLRYAKERAVGWPVEILAYFNAWLIRRGGWS